MQQREFIENTSGTARDVNSLECNVFGGLSCLALSSLFDWRGSPFLELLPVCIPTVIIQMIIEINGFVDSAKRA